MDLSTPQGLHAYSQMLKSQFYQDRCAPGFMRSEQKTVPSTLRKKYKRRLDNNLILNGILVWAHDPTPDENNLPPKPFLCCRTSGGHLCQEFCMNQGGYNHPFLVIDHYQTPGSNVEGDLTLKIVPITSFGGETILQTLSKTSHEKRSNCIPFEFKRTSKDNRAEELALLEKLDKPLLGLEYGEIGRQVFLEVNHIYEVPVKQLHSYGSRKSKYVRLNKESYNKVRSIFGLEYDEESFDRQVETPFSTPSGTPKLDEMSTVETLGTDFSPLAYNPTPWTPQYQAGPSFSSYSSSLYGLPSMYASGPEINLSEYDLHASHITQMYTSAIQDSQHRIQNLIKLLNSKLSEPCFAYPYGMVDRSFVGGGGF